MTAYELKVYRDLKNSLDTAREEGIALGIAQGIERGREEGIERGRDAQNRLVVRNGLKNGLTVAVLAELLGLTEAEVERLARE